MTPPTSRLAVRLAQLPHDVLAELAAELCTDGYAEMRAAAVLAVHQPVPQWAVEKVLLSNDLVPHLLAPLQLEDGAAAAVCSVWSEGWRATSEGRRRLREVPFAFPEELIKEDMRIAVIPGAEKKLVVRFVQERSCHYILDRDMAIISTIGSLDTFPHYSEGFACDEQSIFVMGSSCNTSIPPFDGAMGNTDNAVIQLLHDSGQVVLHDGSNFFLHAPQEEYHEEYTAPVLAPGGLLFCKADNYGDGAGGSFSDIIALDAQTLQLRYRFGRSLLRDPSGMAVVGDELFVCDEINLEVFSLAGEHRRSITGEWKTPVLLRCVNDRLYLVEGDEANGDPLCGRRILVLSLQGDLLESYVLPHEDHYRYIQEVCYFDGKLLASYYRNANESEIVGVIALRGL